MSYRCNKGVIYCHRLTCINFIDLEPTTLLPELGIQKTFRARIAQNSSERKIFGPHFTVANGIVFTGLVVKSCWFRDASIKHPKNMGGFRQNIKTLP